jgi:DNA invertase Pin-like site-specific DNA recombinase
VGARSIDVIVVYKVDRLTRSLADFAKLVELFDDHGVSFVSVTQQFNTMTSMGRLTLNVLLSFAQFEREVTSERIRAARRRQARDVPRSGCFFLPCHRPITQSVERVSGRSQEREFSVQAPKSAFFARIQQQRLRKPKNH